MFASILSRMMSNVRAIVAGHGDFATGILSAVRQITGRDDVFEALSGRDLSAAGVEAALRAALDRTGAVVVFTDLPAGSCTMAARRLQRDRPSLMVVTGANVAALLEFLFSMDARTPDEAAKLAVDRGRAALATAVPGAPRGH